MSNTSSGHWIRTDVSDWDLAGEEPQGLQMHPWLRHDSKERPWLFKAAQPQPGRPLTDDIVEKLASEIAAVLGIPAAPVNLVSRAAAGGCLVETLRPSGWVLQAGQVLLGGVLDDYDPTARGHPGHSVANIRHALDGYGPPPHTESAAQLDAFDVFAGYLLLDAFIANTDRHDRNWAVLVPPPNGDGRFALCGSYDHASSLGFNLSDEQRERTLRQQTVEQWARRASARQFEHIPGEPRRSLVGVAREAVRMCSPEVQQYWRRAFLSLADDQIGEILDRAPGLTTLTTGFTLELLRINRRRVLDALS